MKYLTRVTHDVKANTLEATWVDEVLENGVVVRFNHSNRNYSQEQSAEFAAHVGVDAQKYMTMAGWPQTPIS